MLVFLPAGMLATPFGKLLQWMDEHHVFVILPLFGVLLSAGMLAYVHFRTPPVPEPFTPDAEKGDYCYMDVQLLSGWLLKTTGSASDCFYLAVSPDETMCIVSMNDVIYENFHAIAEYSDVDTAAPISAPQPYRADGIIKQMTRENRELLMEALDVSEEQYQALVGSCYLDLRNDPNGDLSGIFVYVLGASLVLLAISAIVAFDDRVDKGRRGR